MRNNDCNAYFEELAYSHELQRVGAEGVDPKKYKPPKLFKTTFFDEILDRELPPEKWIVDGFIPETGLHLLMGAGKIGKSWFTLQCAQGIALGGSVMGKIPVEKKRVLYISLEERWKLLLKRAKILDFTKTGNNIIVIEDIDRKETPNVINSLDFMLELDPSIKFVIIDTMQLFLNVSDLNDYGPSVNSLRALKVIADKREVSILMIHHTNKSGGNESVDFMERSLGSTGITATCDTTIFLTRPRNEKRADMYITGREVMDKAYTLKMDDNCGWVLEGDKREVVEGETQRLIAEWLKENSPASPMDIFKGLKNEGYKGTYESVKQTCHRMKNAGKLTSESGKYNLFTPADTPVTHVTPLPTKTEPESMVTSNMGNTPLQETTEPEKEPDIY
ncbi:MAG: AAA family ATPase [Treponema sp.]|nr:AAA family ATPase [Treponema sp.]